MSRHALIVGGSSGAGRAAARLFRSKGFEVSVISRRPPTAAQRLPRVLYKSVDILSEADLRPALRDIVADNGKIGCIAFFQRFRGDSDPWQGEIGTAIVGTRNVIELLLNDFNLRDCSIVAVSSVNFRAITKVATVGYHVAKAGLNAMVRGYAMALACRRIRVNSVSPGSFVKEESRAYFKQNRLVTEGRERIIPLRRLGLADEVAQTVLFLCGDRGVMVTGQNIIVDGGLTLVSREEILLGESA